jgi:hypothetical protein
LCELGARAAFDRRYVQQVVKVQAAAIRRQRMESAGFLVVLAVFKTAVVPLRAERGRFDSFPLRCAKQNTPALPRSTTQYQERGKVRQ